MEIYLNINIYKIQMCILFKIHFLSQTQSSWLWLGPHTVSQTTQSGILQGWGRERNAAHGLCGYTLVSGTGNFGGQSQVSDANANSLYRCRSISLSSSLYLCRYTKGIDMWSLGCILGEMIRQKPLFQGTSTINQVSHISHFHLVRN